jgi:hypothetical protein
VPANEKNMQAGTPAVPGETLSSASRLANLHATMGRTLIAFVRNRILSQKSTGEAQTILSFRKKSLRQNSNSRAARRNPLVPQAGSSPPAKRAIFDPRASGTPVNVLPFCKKDLPFLRNLPRASALTLPRGLLRNRPSTSTSLPRCWKPVGTS